jgi:Iron-containing redox enzyme
MIEVGEVNQIVEVPDDDSISARELYAAVADPEESYAAREAVEALRRELLSGGRSEAEDLEANERETAKWSSEEREHVRRLVRGSSMRQPLAKRAVLAAAPLGLVSGGWLQWMSAPGNCDEEVVLQVLSLYASDVDVGNPRASRGEAYLDLLKQMRLADHCSPAARLVHDRRVKEFAFCLPAVLLAMSRRPEEFFAELLGADLCLRSAGCLPALAAVEDLDGIHPDWVALDPAQERGHEWDGGLAQSRTAAACFIRTGPSNAERGILTGFAWARRALGEWADLLRAELASLDPVREMAELLKLRAREAAVYHQDFQLEGRPLSSWLAQSQTDPRPLMEALAASRLVRPQRPGQSPLLTSLIDERGPMFRVFAPEDLAVIRRWIAALSSLSRQESVPVQPNDSPSPLPAAMLARPRGEEGAPASIREAYHLLQRRTDPPGRAKWAEGYVRGWLARAADVLGAGEPRLPDSWPFEGLRPWLLDQHDRHAEQFADEAGASVPTREALIDSTVQTAPLTLIDGSWIHGFTDYQYASTEVGRFLFDTYWDELGNGKLRLNHPRIYRFLLEEMKVDLPPTASREFAESPLIYDGSFELPVYWLSIGRFPRLFMPEILGLNLAMELSGVGGAYRRAKINLSHYGYSTQFVDVHNTIDNVATGHAAWAADAVDTLMTAVGRQARAQTWQRVRTGFVSLNPPLGRRSRRARRRAKRHARRLLAGS